MIAMLDKLVLSIGVIAKIGVVIEKRVKRMLFRVTQTSSEVG